MIRRIYLLTLLGLICCKSQTKSDAQINKDGIETELKTNTIQLLETKWVDQVFPNCFDTIVFNSNISGYIYLCEYETKDSLTYKMDEQELEINIWDYLTENDISKGKEIISKYYLNVTNDTLFMVDIKQKYMEEYQSVDQNYVNQKYFRIK